MSLFIIISYVAPIFIRTGEVAELIHGEAGNQEAYGYSKVRGYLGLLSLGIAYAMAATTTNKIVIGLLFLLPPL